MVQSDMFRWGLDWYQAAVLSEPIVVTGTGLKNTRCLNQPLKLNASDM